MTVINITSVLSIKSSLLNFNSSIIDFAASPFGTISSLPVNILSRRFLNLIIKKTDNAIENAKYDDNILGISIETMQVNAGIAQTQDEWVNTAVLTKEQVISTGLKFYWPHIKMTPTGYIQGNTNVRNYPVQNLATAEIIPIGVTYTWHHMKDQELQSFLINTVHDSMISEEIPEETETLNEITTVAFEQEVINYLDTVYNIDFNIPLEIETETYDNWSSD